MPTPNSPFTPTARTDWRRDIVSRLVAAEAALATLLRWHTDPQVIADAEWRVRDRQLELDEFDTHEEPRRL